MEPIRLDSISRLFADRRFSRRKAVREVGALAAGAVATVGVVHGANAQDAMPMASPDVSVEHPSFMFVQTFGAGSIVDTGNGNLTLTADHLSGQTVYFSDRPERIVGTVSTEHFLGLERSQTTTSFPADATPGASPTVDGGLGFTRDNPPNAALVFNSTGGDTEPGDVLVVELIDPTYDPATGKATYEIKVLAVDTAGDLTLLSEPITAGDAIRSFDAASLFIDDCKDEVYSCYGYDLQTVDNDIYLGDVHFGYCWDWNNACCAPCEALPEYANVACEDLFGRDACSGGEIGESCSVTFAMPDFVC